MKIAFSCDCGAEISDFTRGAEQADLQVQCKDCGSLYAVTITQIQAGDNQRGSAESSQSSE